MRAAIFACLSLPMLAFAEPPASQPAASQPAASQPAASQPAASQPAASQPAASQPASRPARFYAHPADKLAALDPRAPVPLIPMMAWHQKQNMQQHLQAVERIIAGAAAGQWGAVMVAARTIESSPEMQQMCHHMGKGAPGFAEMALDFHARADAIRPAAKREDLAAVLTATAHTLAACNGCHAAYRQDVLDMDTWQTRTSAPPPR